MKNDSKLYKKTAKEFIEDTAIFTTAIFAAGPIGGIAIGYLTATNKKHLSSGFNSALKKWRQKSGQSLTLKAKMLRFRKALSYGLKTLGQGMVRQMNENNKRLEAYRIKSIQKTIANPSYQQAYQKAEAEGLKNLSARER
ncbi:MAG: hypothetical protein Q4F75_03320 [Pseudomonadota bacterium]|nr:hypothetical protein [Pseudomonadota bacterium]